jgi:hypothetical protein
MVRLEPLCRVSLHYVDSSWHRPFGVRGGEEEAVGFGHGDGVVSGEIEGRVVSANAPHRRQDGVWTPNLRGMIRARDGHELLVAIHGQSVEEVAPGHWRAILARVEQTMEMAPFRWLNTCFLVGEGEIDESREDWWLNVFVCVNELAQGPPAIGAEPPARFRQRGAASAS